MSAGEVADGHLGVQADVWDWVLIGAGRMGRPGAHSGVGRQIKTARVWDWAQGRPVRSRIMLRAGAARAA